MSDHTLAPCLSRSALPTPPINLADNAIVKQVRERLPQRIARSFTDAQLRAIAAAFAARPWKHHRGDVRLSLPFPKRRLYFVLLAGSDKRSDERRQAARAEHPLVTVGNIVFAVSVLSVLQLGLLGVLYLAMSLDGIDFFQYISPALRASVG